MDRCLMLFRMGKPVHSTLQPNSLALIKQQVLMCSSSKRDKHSTDHGCETDSAQRLYDWRSGKTVGQTPGRKRASLSPSARLLAELSKDSDESHDSSVGSDSESSGLNCVKIIDSGVDSVSSHCDHQDPLPKGWSVKVEGHMPQISEVGDSKEELKDLGCDPPLRRRKLSPLKRFSEMIPDNYWNENSPSSTVKQDLDSLIKSDDTSKK